MIRNSLFVALLLWSSCQSNDPVAEMPCGLQNPVTELSWLATQISSFEKLKNMSGSALKRTMVVSIGKDANQAGIFYIEKTAGNNKEISVLNCVGTVLCTATDASGCANQKTNMTNVKVIYESL
jgi:hypothetical protein